MSECTNIDLQEQLPDLLSGGLSGGDRVAVEQHLASCAACLAEYHLLEAVFEARPQPPVLDVAAIVAALPAPPHMAEAKANATSAPVLRLMTNESATGRAAAPTRVTPRRRAFGFAGAGLMRFAAAATIVAVGGLSLAVANRTPQSVTEMGRDSVAIGSEAPMVVADLPEATVPYSPEATLVQPVVSVAPAVLPIQELGDYSHEELTLLLEALDEWDGAPRADSSGIGGMQVDPGSTEGS